MSTEIPLDDPRVVALAQARQQLAHEGMLHPTWGGLTPDEQEGSLPDARNYLEAAIRAGLVGPSRAEVLREAADWFDRYDTDSAVQLRRMAERGET